MFTSPHTNSRLWLLWYIRSSVVEIVKHSISRIISVGRFSLLLVLLQPVSTSKPFQTVEGRHLVGGTPPFPPKSLLAKRVTHEKQRYEEDLKQEFGLRHSSESIVEIFACLLNSGKRMVRTTRSQNGQLFRGFFKTSLIDTESLNLPFLTFYRDAMCRQNYSSTLYCSPPSWLHRKQMQYLHSSKSRAYQTKIAYWWWINVVHQHLLLRHINLWI